MTTTILRRTKVPGAKRYEVLAGLAAEYRVIGKLIQMEGDKGWQVLVRDESIGRYVKIRNRARTRAAGLADIEWAYSEGIINECGRDDD